MSPSPSLTPVPTPAEETMVLQRPGERLWAVAAAVAVGLVWGLLAARAGGRLMILAIPAGLLIGLAWGRVTEGTVSRWGHGPGAVGLLAVAITVAGVTASVASRRYVPADELAHDPGLVWAAMEYWMFVNGEPAPPPPPAVGRPMDLEVLERLGDFSPQRQREIVKQYLSRPGGQATRQSQGVRLFGLANGFLMMAGGWIAWRAAGTAGRNG